MTIRTMHFDNYVTSRIPIPKIDFSSPAENSGLQPAVLTDQKQSHDQLVSLVDQMIDVQKQFHNAKTDSDKNTYKQKIDIIDRQIDEQVYLH
jgi:hypothetical protein